MAAKQGVFDKEEEPRNFSGPGLFIIVFVKEVLNYAILDRSSNDWIDRGRGDKAFTAEIAYNPDSKDWSTPSSQGHGSSSSV